MFLEEPVIRANVSVLILVAVAAPILGVTRVGDVSSTTPPVPVDADVEPVPPFAVGSAVPE
jgi:hypothetical protein